MRTRLAHVGICVSLCSAVTACGGDDDEGTAPKRPAPDAAEPQLARPLEPRCGVEGLAAPTVTRSGKGWKLFYSYPSGAPRERRPGDTTVLSLDERSPKARRIPYDEAKTIRVGSIKVDHLQVGGNNVAQWFTKRARYTVITDAPLSQVRRLIRCSP